MPTEEEIANNLKNCPRFPACSINKHPLDYKVELRTKLPKEERCPSFGKCNRNLCPLDYELRLRVGGEGDKCKWMREPSERKIGDKEFISGGRVMPDVLLNFVPESNLEWLNEVSQERWKKLK